MPRFEGIIPAVTTPFTADDQVDVPALKENIEKLIEAGVHGFVATGTMGEAGSLTREERALVVRSVVEASAGRVPVSVGISSGSARQSLEYAADGKEAGRHQGHHMHRHGGSHGAMPLMGTLRQLDLTDEQKQSIRSVFESTKQQRRWDREGVGQHDKRVEGFFTLTGCFENKGHAEHQGDERHPQPHQPMQPSP